MLIYCMGRETEAIVNQINVRAPRAAVAANEERGIAAVKAEDAEGTLYDRTVDALDDYFSPMNNHLHYAVVSMSRSQFPEESNEHFIRNLHELVSRCSGWDQLHN